MTASDCFSVREATLADLDTLVAFNAAMARETEHRELDLDVLRAGVHNLLADASRGVYLVLEEAGRVLAALMLTREWSDWRNGEFWWIQSVYVRPEARRRGCYRRLYEAVRARAAEDPGVCGLRLYVEKANAVAQRTYASLGMSETAYLLYEVEAERAALGGGG